MKKLEYDREGYPGKWLSTEEGAHFFVRNGETAKQAILRFRASQMVNGLPNIAQRILEYERRFGEIATSELKDSVQQELPSGGVTVKKADEKEMTPDEKIASVHIEAGKDTILPPLNEDDLKKLGIKANKPVLVKAYVFERNAKRHKEVDYEDIDMIVGQALYGNDTTIVPGKNESGTYYVFYRPIRPSKTHKGEREFGTVILDIRETNDYFEVVHWQWVREKNMSSVDPNFRQ